MYTFFDPLKAGLNVMGKFSVSELPLTEPVIPAMFKEHWLFCSVVLDPGVPLFQSAPSSFRKYTVLEGGL